MDLWPRTTDARTCGLSEPRTRDPLAIYFENLYCLAIYGGTH
jgi:hypothetical protein